MMASAIILPECVNVDLGGKAKDAKLLVFRELLVLIVLNTANARMVENAEQTMVSAGVFLAGQDYVAMKVSSSFIYQFFHCDNSF